ncbi:phage integrase SAM-like domain-containing protein [Spirosoma gilvum]
MAAKKSSQKELVRLREKALSDGSISLYLDIYVNGRRKYEFLKLYLINAANKADKEKNRETLQLAQSIKAKRQIEIQNHEYGFTSAFKLDTNFLEYFRKTAEARKDSPGNYGNWDSCLKHLTIYAGQSITFRDIDAKFVDGFRIYLEKQARTKSNEPLSQNTQYSYFSKLKSCLSAAFDERITPTNLAKGAVSPKAGNPTRNYLTLDELRALTKAECKYHVLKNAFLFSCLTGLRWSDIQQLTWADVQDFNGFTRLVFTQKKTGGIEYLDINPQALVYMGQRGQPDERVFIGLRYSVWHNMELQKWCMRAGISKTITFHCGRHTFAVLMLDLGTEIFTVSKLLGHKELKTTQIYAKILDKKKQEAVSRIPDIGI